MKKVDSFKCSYCGKLFDAKDSCRSHEYKCYFNPTTKSCASCAFLKFDDYQYKPNFSISVRTCMHNKDVTRKMKTSCENHYPKAELNSSVKIKHVESFYNPIPHVKKHMEKAGLKTEEDVSVIPEDEADQQLIDDDENSLLVEANINKIIGAVGYKIVFIQEVELSNETDFIKDEELEKHTNLYIDEINDVLFLLQLIGFEKEALNTIITKTASELKSIISFPHMLIKQAEINYNLKMAEVADLNGNEDGVYYFKKQAKRMQKLGCINKLLSEHFNTTLPSGSFDGVPEQYYEWCIKNILEIEPDLKEQIKVEIENRTNILTDSSFDHSEIPF